MIEYSGKCRSCKKPFTATKDKASARSRVTCSRSCAVALSWTTPGVRERKIANIRIERQSPEAKARLAAHNARRWAKPEEHERLSNWNKARWADPKINKDLSAAIRKAHAKPAFRKLLSDIRKRNWKNPDYRHRMIERNKIGHNTPEFIIMFKRRLAERWADPVARQKMLLGRAKVESHKRKLATKPLSDAELAVLDAIVSLSNEGVFEADLRALCREAGVSATRISYVVKSLCVKRRVVKSRKVPGALRVVGRGIAA